MKQVYKIYGFIVICAFIIIGFSLIIYSYPNPTTTLPQNHLYSISVSSLGPSLIDIGIHPTITTTWNNTFIINVQVYVQNCGWGGASYCLQSSLSGYNGTINTNTHFHNWDDGSDAHIEIFANNTGEVTLDVIW